MGFLNSSLGYHQLEIFEGEEEKQNEPTEHSDEKGQRVAVFWVPGLGTKACPLTFKPSVQYIERKALAEPGMMGC